MRQVQDAELRAATERCGNVTAQSCAGQVKLSKPCPEQERSDRGGSGGCGGRTTMWEGRGSTHFVHSGVFLCRHTIGYTVRPKGHVACSQHHRLPRATSSNGGTYYTSLPTPRRRPSPGHLACLVLYLSSSRNAMNRKIHQSCHSIRTKSRPTSHLPSVHENSSASS